jgi:hypothetical protein
MSEAVKFYPQIKAAFKYLLPIATALNITHPYEEEDVTYPNFEQYIAGQINASNSDSPSQLDASLGSGSASASSGATSSSVSGSGSPSGTASSSTSASGSAGAQNAKPSESKSGGAGLSAGISGVTMLLVVSSVIFAITS